jgi:hypothetical protein
MTRSAQEIVASCVRQRHMISSPDSFDGSLDELCDRFVIANLPSQRSVAHWHRLLTEYVRSEPPLFLIRYMAGAERGRIYQTSQGQCFKATDNAPAWWFHFALFQELEPSLEDFPTIISTVPSHFFEVAAQLPANISAARWHVAHIFDVKTGDTKYKAWNRSDLVGRFIRNVHPCNYFFIPKQDWQSWGGNERVIAYFVELYKQRYADVWDEFIRLANADPSRIAKTSGSVRYQCGPSMFQTDSRDQTSRSARNQSREGSANVAYRASRLTFKADVIEPLAALDVFRVETPEGVFEMTKADFCRVFPNVLASRSYREGRLYNYSKTPRVALPFLKIGEAKSDA